MTKKKTEKRVFTMPKPTPHIGKNWKQQEAIVPKGLKVQKCYGFTGTSKFEPPKSFQGGFMDEWNQLRK